MTESGALTAPEWLAEYATRLIRNLPGQQMNRIRMYKPDNIKSPQEARKMTINPLAILAAAAAEWNSNPLPAEVEHHTRRAVRDWFAALMPGCADGPALLLAKALASERGQARAISYVDGGLGAPRPAALLNGTASHTTEFDDIFRDGTGNWEVGLDGPGD